MIDDLDSSRSLDAIIRRWQRKFLTSDDSRTYGRYSADDADAWLRANFGMTIFDKLPDFSVPIAVIALCVGFVIGRFA